MSAELGMATTIGLGDSPVAAPIVPQGVPDQQRGEGPGGQTAQGAVARNAEGVRRLRWARLDPAQPAPLGSGRVRGRGGTVSERLGVDWADAPCAAPESAGR